jgi:hypothetical protein
MREGTGQLPCVCDAPEALDVPIRDLWHAFERPVPGLEV